MDETALKNKCLSYVDKLEPVARKRYLEKLKLIDNFDPYLNDSTKAWTTDYENLPKCTYPDLVNSYAVDQFLYNTTNGSMEKSRSLRPVCKRLDWRFKDPSVWRKLPVLSTSFGKTFFAWRFILNENILFLF